MTAFSINKHFEAKRKRKQDGAELCQAQPAKHTLFGSNGAFFGLNCCIDVGELERLGGLDHKMP